MEDNEPPKDLFGVQEYVTSSSSFIHSSIAIRRDLKSTLDDLTSMLSRVPQASESMPPPYSADVSGSAVQEVPAMALGSQSFVRRIYGSIVSEFEIARCHERITHSHKVLTVRVLTSAQGDQALTYTLDRNWA